MRINEISGLKAQESQHHDTCDTNPVLIKKNTKHTKQKEFERKKQYKRSNGTKTLNPEKHR